MSKPLTAAAVAKLKVGKDRREIPDGACPGLYLVLQPTGGRSWALRFRRPDGRPAKLTLGHVHSPPPGAREPDVSPMVGGYLTLAGAHRLVAELRHEILQGRDPAAAYILAKRVKREAVPDGFAACARAYVEGYAKPRVRRWVEIARILGINPSTMETTLHGLASRWAERPVAQIDASDVWAVVDESRKLGHPGVARGTDGPSDVRGQKMHSALSGLFSWLLRERRVTANPCAGVLRPAPSKARDRVLNGDELARVWRACDALDAQAAAVVKMLMLTGCRLREIADLRWSEISNDGATIMLSGERTKNHRPHVIPLAPLAQEIVASAPQIEGCEYVFTRDGRSGPGGWDRTKGKLDSESGVTEWRLHDLRRSAVTGLAELGVRPDVIELCVNHVSGSRGSVAGTYNRSELMPERRAALERWANHVAGLVEGRPANIVALARA